MNDRGDNVLFLVGAGSVVNAWAPVLRALGSIPDFEGISSPDIANLGMARAVYQARAVCSLDFKIVTERKSGNERKVRDDARLQAINGLMSIRTAIAKHLQQAEQGGELAVRPEFQAIVDKLVVEGAQNITVITANWDTCIDSALPNKKASFNVRHLHGQSDRDATLYLPTEIAREPYRSDSDGRDRAADLLSLWNAREDCDRMVVYGLSFSALDAELAVGVAGDPDGKLPAEITIVDPEHQLVRDRMESLIRPSRRKEVEMRGCRPGEVALL